jgi:hypothetical protein
MWEETPDDELVGQYSSVEAAKVAFDSVFDDREDFEFLEPAVRVELLRSYRPRARQIVRDTTVYFEKRAAVRGEQRAYVAPYVDLLGKYDPTFDRVGARSKIYNGIELIGLHSATPYVFLQVFSALLRDPDILRGVGSPQLETKPKEAIALPRTARDIATPLFPSDAERRDYAINLALIATDSIVLHEMGHHFFGHVRLLEETFRSRREGAPILAEDFDGDLRRSLELDADMFAQMILAIRAVDIDLGSGRKVHDRGPRSHIFMTAFAISSAFSLFPGTATTNRYPSPDLRRFCAGQLVATLCGQETEMKPIAGDVLRAYVGGVEACGHAFSTSTGDDAGIASMLKAFRDGADSELWKEYEQVEREWQDVRRLLLPFTKGRLA